MDFDEMRVTTPKEETYYILLAIWSRRAFKITIQKSLPLRNRVQPQ